MPSVESLALTNAIRHAADMRSSSYSPSCSSSSEDNHEYLDYEPKGEFKEMTSDEFTKMFQGKDIYILDFGHIMKDLVIPASILFEKKHVYAAEACGYDTGFRKTTVGEFKLEPNRWFAEYDLDLTRRVKFIDQYTVINRYYVISINKESIKKVVDKIFSCENWKGADEDMKKCQYDLIIKELEK